MLLLAAAHYEVAPLLALAQAHGRPLSFFEVGVGPLEATARLACYLQKHTPTHCLLLGSAGWYRPSPPVPNPLVTITQVLWAPQCSRAGLSELIYPPRPIALTPASGFPCATAVSCPAITLDPRWAPTEAGLANLDRNNLVENLELYAIARLLDGLCPLTAILGITNSLCPTARTQYRQNAQPLADHMARTLLPYLAQGHGLTFFSSDGREPNSPL